MNPIEITKSILRNASKAEDGAYVGGMLYAVYSAYRKDGMADVEAMVKAATMIVAVLSMAKTMDSNKKEKPDGKE